MLGDSVVQRQVNTSIIYFDVCAVLIWLIALALNHQWRPFMFSIIGFCVYYFVDAVVWMTWMKTRTIQSPFNPYLTQLWLQLGPGIIHPSFFCLLLEGTFGPQRKKVCKEFWVTLFIGVQFVPAFMQQSIQLDQTIIVSRTMKSQRWLFILLGVMGYMYLISLYVSAPNLWRICLYSIVVEGCFELSLYLSEIRKATLETIILDSVIEFNVGAGLIVFLWRCMYSKEERAQMRFNDEVKNNPATREILLSCIVCWHINQLWGSPHTVKPILHGR